MTIPFGRRRLILSVALTPAQPERWDDVIPPGTDDVDLARLSRRDPMDLDRARWEGLSLIYGGARKP